jgi:hypothetical protein
MFSEFCGLRCALGTLYDQATGRTTAEQTTGRIAAIHGCGRSGGFPWPEPSAGGIRAICGSRWERFKNPRAVVMGRMFSTTGVRRISGCGLVTESGVVSRESGVVSSRGLGALWALFCLPDWWIRLPFVITNSQALSGSALPLGLLCGFTDWTWESACGGFPVGLTVWVSRLLRHSSKFKVQSSGLIRSCGGPGWFWPSRGHAPAAVHSRAGRDISDRSDE